MAAPDGSSHRSLDHVVELSEARRLAEVNHWREKTLIYVTRRPDELLVLDHTDEYPEAGTQVPAGGVDPGEQPAQTAARELAEETGLHLDSPPVYLESRIWRGTAPSMVRHYFWAVASPDTPDRWSHTVSAGEQDEGMLFWLTFRPRRTPGLTPGYGWDAALDRLDDVIGDVSSAEGSQHSPLPELDTLVAVADAGLHPWIVEHVSASDRSAALSDEIGFWLNTAAQDPDYARGYARHAPSIGLPDAAYLDRWLPLASGTSVLAGPRYLGQDPDLPFVGVTASDRVLGPDDQEALVALARTEFAPFTPKFVLLNSSTPARAWRASRSEKRVVVGVLGELRNRPIAPSLSFRAHDVAASYDDYAAIYARDQAADPNRRRWARVEDREDFERLSEQGMIFDVLVDGEWAGVVAAELENRSGMPGAVVQELTLDQRFRGNGYGRQLSLLLARALPLDDDQLVIGTIHADNMTAYRSALASGRVDVGGEILIPL